MESFLQDLRHSLRMFWQSPSFPIAAVSVLALGIGANTAIFSLVNTILLKPPPFAEAGRIVLFMNTSPQGSGSNASPAKFAHWAKQTDAIESAAAFRTGVVNWPQRPEQLRSAQVSREFFRLFGALILRGREFSAEEDRPKAAAAVLIGETLWRAINIC